MMWVKKTLYKKMGKEHRDVYPIPGFLFLVFVSHALICI